ncbi:MAG: PEP-CTERM sorting domain-containing protein [Planctomycetota bacterium]
MTNNDRPTFARCLTLSAAAALLFVPAAEAQDLPEEGIFGGISNFQNFTSASLELIQDDQGASATFEQDAGPFESTLNTSATFSGTDGTFSVTGFADASSVAGALRASASITVSGNNVESVTTPFVLPDGSFDENGVPTAASFTAIAGFRDVLQYGGTARNYTSRYFLRLTGSFSAEGGGSVQFDITHGDAGTQSFFFDGESDDGDTIGDGLTVNELIVTEAFVHGGSPQEIEVSLLAIAETSVENAESGFTAFANFGSTLEIVGYELSDTDTGQIITNVGVTTSDGSSLPVIPEPTTAAMLGFTGLALMARRRRACR